MQIPNGQKKRSQMKVEFQMVIPQPRPFPVCLFKYSFLFVHLSSKRPLPPAPKPCVWVLGPIYATCFSGVLWQSSWCSDYSQNHQLMTTGTVYIIRSLPFPLHGFIECPLTPHFSYSSKISGVCKDNRGETLHSNWWSLNPKPTYDCDPISDPEPSLWLQYRKDQTNRMKMW